MTLLGDVTGKEIGVFQDPFKKNCIGDMFIHYHTGWSGGGFWTAFVEFKNGYTSGKQEIPNSKTFEEVVTHLKIILNSLEK